MLLTACSIYAAPLAENIKNKRLITFTEERERLIMLVLMNSGLRESEVLKLKAGDLTITEDRILKITVRGKGGVQRTSPVIDIFGLFKSQFAPAFDIEIDNIGIYLYHKLGANQLKPSEPLFDWANRHTLYWLTWALNHYDFEVNGKGYVYDITPHRFRHTYATYLYTKLDFTLEEVKDALGHKSLNTTLIYAKLDKSKMDAKIVRGEIANGQDVKE